MSSATEGPARLDSAISLAEDDPISPSALSCACWAYACLENYAESLADFRNAIADRLDLSEADHLDALVRWLNKWKSRLPEFGHAEVKRRLQE